MRNPTRTAATRSSTGPRRPRSASWPRAGQALGQIDAWLETASAVLLAEGETYWPRLRDLLADGKISGPAVHDARIAALCLTHGVQALWTADRNFTRFPRLRTVNPLI